MRERRRRGVVKARLHRLHPVHPVHTSNPHSLSLLSFCPSLLCTRPYRSQAHSPSPSPSCWYLSIFDHRPRKCTILYIHLSSLFSHFFFPGEAITQQDSRVPRSCSCSYPCPSKDTPDPHTPVSIPGEFKFRSKHPNFPCCNDPSPSKCQRSVAPTHVRIL